MIALDTNVLVRAVVADEPDQARIAQAIFAGLDDGARVFVCREVMVEFVWVLERAYGLSRAEIADAVTVLLESRGVVVEAADRVGLAASRYRAGGPGFSDQMIRLAAEVAGCATLTTFDRKLAAQDGATLAG